MKELCVSNLKDEITKLLIEHDENWEVIETITFPKSDEDEKPYYLKHLSVEEKQN